MVGDRGDVKHVRQDVSSKEDPLRNLYLEQDG